MKPNLREIQGLTLLEQLELDPKFTVTIPMLMTEEELSKLIRKSPRTLLSWRQSGTGPSYIKVGGSVLYSVVDVMDWITKNTIPPD